MTPESFGVLLLSSSVLAATIGAIVAGVFNMKVKHREYENEYFKIVLSKRIAAYELVQKLVTGFKTAVVDSDGKPYHLIFSREGDLSEVHVLLAQLNDQALWLTNDLFDRVRDLSRVLFQARSFKDGTIEFAKLQYQEFALFREDLERMQVRDMLSLHQVRQFLRKKEVKSGFENVKLGSGSA